MKRKASAVWHGDLKHGKGSFSTQSKVLQDAPYSFVSRFGDSGGTNPEEMIAAAHAACFTMALSLFLERAGFTADKLTTEATLSLEQEPEGWSIATIHLDLTGKVPGIEQAMFAEIAGNAKENCPVSRVLNATITLDTKLEK